MYHRFEFEQKGARAYIAEVRHQGFKALAKINGIAAMLYCCALMEQFKGLPVVGKVLSDKGFGLFS